MIVDRREDGGGPRRFDLSSLPEAMSRVRNVEVIPIGALVRFSPYSTWYTVVDFAQGRYSVLAAEDGHEVEVSDLKVMAAMQRYGRGRHTA
jgi:hypothetical protein